MRDCIQAAEDFLNDKISREQLSIFRKAAAAAAAAAAAKSNTHMNNLLNALKDFCKKQQ